MIEFINKWKIGLEKTRKVAFGKIAAIFGATQITDETWDELESILIQADLGVDTSISIISNLKSTVSRQGLTRTDELQGALSYELLSRLDEAAPFNLDSYHPGIIMLVGVNGSGKTTTAAKLGKQFSSKGKKVLLVAADTYRAAAIDQLQVWGERLNIPVLGGQMGGDPGAVAYDGIQSALTRDTDIVIVDTAGRLHTRYNLMEELKKVNRVIGKTLPGAPHATWLVLDATTGQNALAQAKAFRDAVKINGVILAKLDSSAKGGMAFAIKKELDLPILYAGLGEKPDDLTPFNREAFVNSIINMSSG
jgi:fused signal recognition particle receptor